MQIKPEQLDTHLKKSALAPVYVLAGDEPLRVMEAADTVRARSRAEGYSERVVIDVDAGFDWNDLLREASSMSLFAERRLIDLRLRHFSPGRDGGAVLVEYTSNPPADTVLLITAAKLESRVKQSKWFRSLDGAGVTMDVWPIEARDLPGWLVRRAERQQCRLSKEAARLIADRTEGNLLAAAQEIDKLALLFPDEVIDAERVLGAVSDSARFDAFAFVETVLAGDGARVGRTLQTLRAEGEPAVLVAWALHQQLRTMCQLVWAVESGVGIDQAVAAQRVFWKSKPLVKQAVHRHALRAWQGLLRRSARIEEMIKGRRTGNVWDELLRLALLVAGAGTAKG